MRRDDGLVRGGRAARRLHDAEVREDAVHARRRLGRSAAGRRGPLDALATEPLEAAACRRRRRSEWELAADEQMQQVVKRGIAQASPELASCRARRVGASSRGRRTAIASAPAHRRPHRPHRTAPAAGVIGRQAALRVRLLPALGAGLLHGLRRTWPRRPRFRLPPRRLHLRRTARAEHRARRTTARDHDAGRLPHALRALSQRSQSAGRARDVAVHRHLGRSRSRQRLRRRRTRKTMQPRDAFLARRAQAYQAYYEHMPLRAAARPRRPRCSSIAGSQFGRLADFLVLDTRQYRHRQPCGTNRSPRSATARSIPTPRSSAPRRSAG